MPQLLIVVSETINSNREKFSPRSTASIKILVTSTKSNENITANTLSSKQNSIDFLNRSTCLYSHAKYFLLTL